MKQINQNQVLNLRLATEAVAIATDVQLNEIVVIEATNTPYLCRATRTAVSDIELTNGNFLFNIAAGTGGSAQSGSIGEADDENTSTGNELHLTLANTGVIQGRHGNFLGDVTVNRIQAGQYSIAPAGPVLDDTTSVMATARNAAGAVRSCNYTITLGEVFVDVKDGAGTLQDDAVSVSIYW